MSRPAAMPSFAMKALRSLQELADAAAALKRAGFTECGACSAWHNEDMRCEAFGAARDPRCPVCGTNPALLVED